MSHFRKLIVVLACTALWLAAPTVAQAADDVTPPTAPGVPIFSNVTPFGATLTWAQSTDDTGVANYFVRRGLLNGQTWNESLPGDVNTITIRDLTPNQSYSFTVIAIDAAGNSAAAPATSVRTLAYTDGPLCSVRYQPISTTSNTFFATIEMTNLTPGAWQEWTLSFTLTDGQRVSPEWGFQQNGNRWSTYFVWLWTSGAGPLLPGNTRPVSFSGTYTGTNLPPTNITINDQPCGLAGPLVPPGPPQNLAVTSLTAGSIGVGWRAATAGTNPISRYEVLVNGIPYTCVGVNPLACLISGLVPGAVYVIAVRAVDTTGLVGPTSTIVVQTPSSTPPSPPGNLTASGITSTSAILTWTPSTPGSFPLSGYTIYRLNGTTETAVSVTPNASTTTATLTGLTPNTPYSFRVRARDSAGVMSAPSATASFTTARPPGGCDVAYSTHDWSGGFSATVKITNTSTQPINGWTLRFALPAGQRLTHGWNATWSQPSGTPNVTATNLTWNAVIAPGASVTAGFNATSGSTNPEPSAFSLNGNACTIS